MLVINDTLPDGTSTIKLEKLVSYELGYWLWLTSIFLILVAVIVRLGEKPDLKKINKVDQE